MDPRLAALVKALAFGIERGLTENASIERAWHEFGGITNEMMAEALGYLHLGQAVQHNLTSLPPDAEIGDALLGEEPPAERVMVRVMIRSINPQGEEWENSAYLDLAWTDRIQDVYNAASDWVDKTLIKSDPYRTIDLATQSVSQSVRFVGPTILPPGV
jgi:hypothetical protein